MNNNISNIIKTRRTIRKFDTNKKIDKNILINLVDVGRLYPSRMNKQPLEFIIINSKDLCGKIFKNILWGIKNKVNQAFADVNYAPTAYIAILQNKNILSKGFEYDVGASAQNIMIYANSLGIGSVFLHSIMRKNIIELLNIPNEIYNLDSLIGLGYPKHKSFIIDFDNDYKYYLDNNHNIYVPKKNIKNIMHINKYGNN